MTDFQRTKHFNVLLVCSLILNLSFLNMFLQWRGVREQTDWTRNAVEEAEAVSSVSCSGHGRAFLDGSAVSGKPVCECHACFEGPDCSEFIQGCELDADSGDPTFLEPFWVKQGGKSAVLIPGWHRMSYEFNDGSLESAELKTLIRKLHAVAGNANMDGRYIIFGAGATQLLNAAVHALSSDDHPVSSSPSTSRVVASVPYYPVYKHQTEFFRSEDYKFNGDASSWKNSMNSSSNYVEFVTSPNNPDGQLKKAVLQGPSVKAIHDLAYYWPHFTPIPAPANEDLMIFTISKLTGHAGSRFGWALVKDEAVYQRMLNYMSLSVYGIPRETQLRVLKLLKVVLENEGKEMFEFGSRTMMSRWRRLSKVFSMSRQFSLQDLEPQFCSFSGKFKMPSPAFAWIKCQREEENDCFEALKAANIIGRKGTLFGADSRYVRLSLVKTEHEFEMLLQRIEALVREENSSSHIHIQGNGSTINGSIIDLGRYKDSRCMADDLVIKLT